MLETEKKEAQCDTDWNLLTVNVEITKTRKERRGRRKRKKRKKGRKEEGGMGTTSWET